MTSEERRNLELRAADYYANQFDKFVEDVGLQDWMSDYFNEMLDEPGGNPRHVKMDF